MYSQCMMCAMRVINRDIPLIFNDLCLKSRIGMVFER